MSVSSEPIVRRKLSAEVFARLKAMITEGELKPGDAMPSERELMERFGVGRPAIREAMQSLAGIGLLAISHGERARVLKMTPRSLFGQVDAAAAIMLQTSPTALDHLKEARIFFERGLVVQAAERATAEDVAALEALMAAQRAALGDADTFIAADMRFHQRIAAISGNPILEAVAESMLGWLKQYHTDLLIWTGKENLTLVEHEEIVAAIRARDAGEAESAMVRHLERSRALYVHQAG
ncbi:transcriptional regulator NanR [Aurantimonas sp. Leaf443]|uniref:transcriptional regulator NanR n=1 Tax=Aurantimonas sp. Leaf443 TaxID=1736378 RepID=UPI0006FE9C06|nr:transcriptional regulator NanR [Aurantimonas sp. Leaf443]KQT82800.1 GntR family transcriptional regulator [Aurantimonas sp. Leaf443]